MIASAAVTRDRRGTPRDPLYLHCFRKQLIRGLTLMRYHFDSDRCSLASCKLSSWLRILRFYIFSRPPLYLFVLILFSHVPDPQENTVSTILCFTKYRLKPHTVRFSTLHRVYYAVSDNGWWGWRPRHLDT